MSASNLILHPLSHNWPIEMRDRDFNAGTMCTRRASRGRLGMSNSPVCEEYMRDPLGFWMTMGCRVSILFVTGMSVVKKWAVLPVSAIACMVRWVGGPTDEVECVKDV